MTPEQGSIQSAGAKAGTILIIAGILVGWISLLLIILGTLPTQLRLIPLHLFPEHGVLLMIMKVSGIFLAMIALYLVMHHRYSFAGILGLIATVLPPIDILLLLGSLLLLISPEGRRSAGKSGGIY